MENLQNLSLEDQSTSSSGGAPGTRQLQQQPPAIPQMPPQMFTTAAQLLDLTDKKILTWLRDNRKLFGILRSWDQFGNIVLESCVERLYSHSRHLFADIQRGLFVVRGENVLLIGEIDLEMEDEPLPGGEWSEGKLEEVRELVRVEEEERRKREKEKLGRLRRLGFEGETGMAEGHS